MDDQRFSILLNARPLNTIFTGVARYTRSLYQHINKLNQVRVSYFCNGRIGSTMPEQSKDVMSRHFPVWVRHIARRTRLAVEDHLLRRYLHQSSYDIYHETGTFPLTTSTSVAKVLTIYDLSLITHPECHPPDRVEHFERYFYRRLPAVDHVITISEFTRSEVIAHLDLPPHKVTVVPLAASAIFSRRAEQDVRDFLRARKLPNDYVLTVGTREPRKNLQGLLRGYARLRTDMPLLCVGWSGWMSRNLPREVGKLGLHGRVRMLGHVTDEDLALLYAGARVMVYPSLYEGFGLPILEAMACGCPVVCSNRSSMPEVAGDAAVLVEPEDDQDIADGLSRVLEDGELRRRCIEWGRERAKLYSWERAASRTIALFQQVAAQSDNR